eukprot:TRINITY_DN3707_c0_g1_i2.p1 TRINITY_DN3707_c0_g1~~TRINITY_DN3707_c0_g1_i2.p1  ORF type:complete len:403 (-),score=112.39 TRINITY_DN3707_c0_g1_i2:113-1321(-)
MCRRCVAAQAAIATVLRRNTNAPDGGAVIVCACCNQTTPVAEAQTPNWHLKEVADKFVNSGTRKCCNCDKSDATADCTECARQAGAPVSLCDECWALAHAVQFVRGHRRQPVGSADRQLQLGCCRRHHNNALELYCRTDGALACPTCAFSAQHKGHDLVAVEDFAAGRAEELQLAQASLQDAASKVRRAADAAAAAAAAADRRQGDFAAALNACFSEAHARLDERRDALLSAAETLRSAQSTRIDAQRQRLEAAAVSLEALLRRARDAAEMTEPTQVLVASQQVLALSHGCAVAEDELVPTFGADYVLDARCGCDALRVAIAGVGLVQEELPPPPQLPPPSPLIPQFYSTEAAEAEEVLDAASPAELPPVQEDDFSLAALPARPLAAAGQASLFLSKLFANT